MSVNVVERFQNTSEVPSPTDVTRYTLECWASVGLIIRTTVHVCVWTALREQQGYNAGDVHPLETDCGLGSYDVVLSDEVNEAPPENVTSVSQMVTAGVGLVLTSGAVTAPVGWSPLLLVLLAPSAAVMITDPVVGYLRWRSS